VARPGMGYSVHLYRSEVRAKAEPHPELLEDTSGLPALHTGDVRAIEVRLELAGFAERRHGTHGRHFVQAELGAEALLTKTGLFLIGRSEDAIFEIGMMASELASERRLAKFDPQEGSWE